MKDLKLIILWLIPLGMAVAAKCLDWHINLLIIAVTLFNCYLMLRVERKEATND